jgi:hypothetical protein
VTALYERQRALVRIGLLPPPSKTGRNSGGAMATPGNVGIMLLSVLVTDRLSEMDDRILEFLMLHPAPFFVHPFANPDCCTLTGERTLYRAMQAILENRTAATYVEISVDRRRKLVRLEDITPDSDADACIFGKQDEFYSAPIKHLVTFSDLFGLSQELECVNHPERVKNFDISPADKTTVA